MKEPRERPSERAGRSRRLGLRRAASAAGLVVAFTATSQALRELVPPPLQSTLELALAELERQPEVTTVFIGSSRIARGVDPGVFDRVAEARGVPVRSFVVARPGMNAIEVEYAVRRVLHQVSANLRTVLIEPGLLTSYVDDRVPHTRRFVEWHDARGTWLALRTELESGFSIRTTWRHVEAAAERVGGIGRLAAWLGETKGRDVGLTELFGEEKRGYVPLDELIQRSPRASAARRERLTQNPGAFEKRVQTARAGHVPEDGLALLGEIIDDLAERAESAGVRAVFLIPVSLNESSPRVRAALAERPQLATIDLGDPRTCPELYDIDHWFDTGHLNETGARLHTERIADEWLSLERGSGEGS